MGLDMYLSANQYLSSIHTEDVALNHKIKTTIGNCLTDELSISYITYRVGYWRKANAIHQWFVENCQEGIDDCKSYYVSSNNLNDLLDRCKTIIVKHNDCPDNWTGLAMQLLPPQSGFFFGSTEIDAYYLEDIQNTIPIIEKAIVLSENGLDISYQSSW